MLSQFYFILITISALLCFALLGFGEATAKQRFAWVRRSNSNATLCFALLGFGEATAMQRFALLRLGGNPPVRSKQRNSCYQYQNCYHNCYHNIVINI